MTDGAVAALVERLRTTRKYRDIHVTTIEDIVRRAVAAGGAPREHEQRARRQLHKIAAQYLTERSTRDLVGEVESLPDGDVRGWCRAAMAGHLSTAERLPDLDALYDALAPHLAGADVIADVACALNVLSLPWLRDRTAARYVGYDFDASVVALGNRFISAIGVDAEVVHADVLVDPSVVVADVALLLKMYHCLELRRPGAGCEVIEGVQAPVVVVSLPTRSRGGRRLGFDGAHGARLADQAAQRGWSVEVVEVPSEVAWLIRR